MWLSSAITAFFFVLAACASTPLPSRAAFSEQILEPLAAQRADELLTHWQAAVHLHFAQHRPADELDPFDALILSALPPIKELAKAGVQADAAQHKLREEQTIALLLSRRSALKGKLLNLYAARLQELTVEDHPAFAVCANGTERRYERAAGFRRLDDGPTPCPPVKITWEDFKP